MGFLKKDYLGPANSKQRYWLLREHNLICVMMIWRYFFLIAFLVSQFTIQLFCQTETPRKELNIQSTNEKIVLDGMLNEGVWQKADKADNFWQYFPFDTSLSVSKSEVMMTYDEENIYVAIIVYDSLPGEI